MGYTFSVEIESEICLMELLSKFNVLSVVRFWKEVGSEVMLFCERSTARTFCIANNCSGKESNFCLQSVTTPVFCPV